MSQLIKYAESTETRYVTFVDPGFLPHYARQCGLTDPLATNRTPRLSLCLHVHAAQDGGVNVVFVVF